MTHEQEIKTYRRELPKLLQTPGRFVLIKGKRVLGVFEDRDSALDAAYQQLGPRVAFLVKKIEAVERPIRVPFDARIFQHVSDQTANHRKRGRR